MKNTVLNMMVKPCHRFKCYANGRVYANLNIYQLSFKLIMIKPAEQQQQLQWIIMISIRQPNIYFVSAGQYIKKEVSQIRSIIMIFPTPTNEYSYYAGDASSHLKCI